jgi:hypothetical protein
MKIGLMYVNKRHTKNKYFMLFIALLFLLFFVLIYFQSNSVGVFNGLKKEVNEYVDKNNMFSFKYPKGWVVTSSDFEDTREIIKHVEFSDAITNAYGFIEVWKNDDDLKEFILQGKKHAVGNLKFKYYKLYKINVNGNDGYETDSSRLGDDYKYYRCKDSFFKIGSRIYRLNFCAEDSKWNKNIESIQSYMISNFKFNK